jgi:excisionase family DNA binding protein
MSELDTERLWTVKDVAAYLGFKKSWVYARVDEGVLPHLRIVGRIRFDPDAVRAWALQQGGS